MKKIFLYICFAVITIGVFFIGKEINDVKANEYPFTGTIVADALVIHSTSELKSQVTQLAYGTRVQVINKIGNAYEIKYDNGKIGYGYYSYVVNVDAATKTDNSSGIETYVDYCTMLGQEGFPDSYCPYLYHLHTKYPKWIFKADKISMSLDDVAKSEEWKTVLQSNNSNYWLSSKPIEGDYYYIKSNVIKSFLDPRNSMFEKYIFQFHNLQKNVDVYNESAMKNIANGGNLSKYVSSYMQAGVNEGVTPIHMITRSRQEGMNNASFGSVSGKYTTNKGFYTPRGYSVDGYYNYFNVGAWEDGAYTTVGRGLAYGAGLLEDEKCISQDANGKHYYDESKCGQLSDQRPWNTPEKAILGGAYFLAEKYVKAGQNTLYFQKFNVSTQIKQENLYTHQYMTNIYAPVNESSIMYNGYSAGGLLNSAFEFFIPVYKNMGEIYQPVDKNGESRLSTIKINNEVITGFDNDVVEYEVNVITTENTINVVATPMASTTTVSGTGTYTFVSDKTKVEIDTVAEDGSTLKYIVNVTKVTPENKVTVSDIVGKLAVKVNGNIMYGISPGTNAATVINTVVNNKGKAKIYNASGAEKSNGALATGDKIVINGTSEASTYTIAVRGDTSGDGAIKINDLILVQSHILGTKMLSGAKLYAGDTSYDGPVKINDLILIQSHILEKGKL